MDKYYYMSLAIDKAWRYQFLTYPNPAVGATVVKNGTVFSTEAHKEAGKSHAEVLALKSAYLVNYPHSPLKDIDNSQKIHEYLTSNHNDFFRDCEIYVTLEPCNHFGKTPACAKLLKSIEIKKVYIGTLDPNNDATGGMQRLQNAGIEVEIDICKDETDKLLFPFTQYQRGYFSFFKMAMREDGSIDGGYITTQDSLNLVHEIRTKIDLMVIGGNTVRIDRPTLDARFSRTKKTSDILIYSKQNNFDKKIPLFNIKHREVTISNSLTLMKKRNFTMIEGGHNFLEILDHYVEYLMIFISHKSKTKKAFRFDENEYSLQYSYYLNKYDEILYLKKINAV